MHRFKKIVKFCFRLALQIFFFGPLDFRSRPKKIKVFLQPHAGKKTAKATYCQKIRPIFQAAGVEEDCIGK